MGQNVKKGTPNDGFACTLSYWITLASWPTRMGGLPCKTDAVASINAVAQLMQCAKVTPYSAYTPVYLLWLIRL